MEYLKHNLKSNGHLIITILFVLPWLLTPAMGLSEIPEPPKDIPWYIQSIKYMLSQFPEINAWFAAVMVFIMSLLRGLADAFIFIAKRTETQTDDIIAQELSKLLRWASAIVGWFGLGSPRK